MAAILEGDRSCGAAQSLGSPRLSSKPATRSHRERDLRHTGLFLPWQVTRTDIASRRLVIERLDRVCRSERRRGLAGHWSYDEGRHRQLLSILRDERAELAAVIQHSFQPSETRHGA